MIFLICAILGTIELQIGTALGLFAIFAIIRFRTVQYTVKDITYVFIIIGISVINSQANIPPPILGAIVINVSILLITYILEIFLLKKSLTKLLLTYNKIELLKPGFNNELLKDLSRHTGQNIERVIIKKINIEKSNARLEVYFKDIKTE
jgi:multisubunit Na+/H+ antiporter MnhG subunit